MRTNRPNELPLTCITAEAFTWTGTVGVSEESSLPEHLVSRVFRDANDFGFLVKSPRTGRVLLFVAETDMRGPGGEFQGTVFRCVPEPSLTIEVLND